jgi:DNA-binding NarL/FixJ family response regulator
MASFEFPPPPVSAHADAAHGGPAQSRAAARPTDEVTGNVVVFSRSELIGDGLVGLLPRELRGRIAVISDLPALERSLSSPPTSVIIDGDTPAAGEAIELTRTSGGSAIVLIKRGGESLDPAALEQADAIIPRDEAEALTLRIAIAAGRLGLRLVPRSPPVRAGAPEPSLAELSDTAQRALGLLAGGMRDAEIARELHLSESAVRKLIQRTVRAVGARTRCQAVAIAARDPLSDRTEEYRK